MRNSMIFAKGATYFLLLVLAMTGVQVRAQNQTPANVALVGWTDPDTGLTWTKADNGSGLDWGDANAYCKNLRLGKYTDWRLPTIDELEGIYDFGIDVTGQWGGEAVTWHVKGNLKLSGDIWSSSLSKLPRNDWVWYFRFRYGARDESRIDIPLHVLCVRR
jgi:hypothetical protein